jgi:hypothetical protein
MKNLLIIALLALSPVLAAQAPDEQARRITERPEYRGYRVERPPGSTPGDGGDGADAGPDDGAHSGSGRGTDDGASRRGTGPGGSGRGSGSSGWGGGGGSGLSAPTWLGGLFEVIAWIILAAGVAIALFFIVKALLGIKWKGRKKSQKSKRKKADKAGQAEMTKPAIEPIVVDEQVFEDALEKALRDYKQALADEDYAAATLLAYRIFWLRAGWQGCVETADVRTWRDALRMVRAAEIRGEVRALLPMVERVRYADYRPHKGEFNTWSLNLEKIEPAGVLK